MMGGLNGMREGPKMDVNVLCIGRYNIWGWYNRGMGEIFRVVEAQLFGRSSSLIHFSHIFSDFLEIRPPAEDLFTNSSISITKPCFIYCKRSTSFKRPLCPCVRNHFPHSPLRKDQETARQTQLSQISKTK